MDMKRRAASSMAAAAVCLALAGCSDLLEGSRGAEAYHDDALIAQEADSYSAVNFHGMLPGDVSFGGLSGAVSLLALDVSAAGGKLEIDCNVEVSAGDFKLVLVAAGASADVLCEGTGSVTLARMLDPGRYAIKAVGRNAAAAVDAHIRATETISAFAPGDAFGLPEPVELGRVSG